MDGLQDLRGEIDAIDRQMVELFRRRMDVTARVGQYKRERGIPVLDQARERQVLQNKGELAGEELPLVLGTSLGWCSQGTYPRTLPPEVTNRRHKEHREATDQELEGVRVMQTLEYITASAERAGMELDYIDVSDDLCTSVLWNKHVLIQLGTELELDRKMAFAKAILEEELGADFIGTIDVSVLPKNSRAYTREAKPEEFIHPFYLEHYYKY